MIEKVSESLSASVALNVATLLAPSRIDSAPGSNMLGALLSAALELPPPPHPVTANTNEIAATKRIPFLYIILVHQKISFFP